MLKREETTSPRETAMAEFLVRFVVDIVLYGPWSMIPESGNRFSEKIMLKQEATHSPRALGMKLPVS